VTAMVLSEDLPIIIIAPVLILVAFPFLGRLLYIFKNRIGRLLSVYFLSFAAFFALNMILSDEINLMYIVDIFNQLKGIKFVYILSLILYFIAGFGLFGSVSERSVEVLEDANLTSTLERRRSLIKQYLMYLFYGYVFAFSVYALTRIVLIGLGVSYKFPWQQKLYMALGFENVLLVLVGAALFLLKCFNYGIFSREYWKTLSVEESEDTTWRVFRKLIIIFVFVWAVYITFILFFVQIFRLETSLFTASILTYNETVPIFNSLHLVFYITTVFQTLYFFSNMYKLVSSLKSVDPNFKKKVDTSIKIDEEDDEITF
jgi:hypothetical protein